MCVNVFIARSLLSSLGYVERAWGRHNPDEVLYTGAVTPTLRGNTKNKTDTTLILFLNNEPKIMSKILKFPEKLSVLLLGQCPRQLRGTS